MKEDGRPFSIRVSPEVAKMLRQSSFVDRHLVNLVWALSGEEHRATFDALLEAVGMTRERLLADIRRSLEDEMSRRKTEADPHTP